MRAAIRGSRRAAFVLLLALGVGVSGTGARAEPLPGLRGPEELGIRIEGELPEPYRLSRFKLRFPGALPRRIELQALDWEGDVLPLFFSEPEAWASELELACFLPAETRRLLLELEDKSGIVLVDLGAPGSAELPGTLANLSAPLRLARPRGGEPRILEAGGRGAQALAQVAVNELFAAERSWYPLAAAAAFALGWALVGAFAPRRARAAASLALTALALAVVLAGGPREAWYWELGLPAASAGGGALEGHLEPADLAGPGRSGARWGAEDAPLVLMALETPHDSLLPLELLERPGAAYRFDRSPRILERGGRLYVGAGGFLSGWRLTDD